MDVLLVGAGAVGQVYGRHLSLGGARVSVFVKEKHADQAREGFTMYPLRSRKRRDPVRFVPHAVLTQLAEVHARGWDQVWLCTPSNALEGPWVEELLRGIEGATVVSLQPTLAASRHLASLVGPERVVTGAIAMVSYQAPLPGESVPSPGVAYHFPLRAPSRFSGLPARAEPLVRALRAGGCPARLDRGLGRVLELSTAVMMPMIVALEAAGWSLGGFSRGPLLKTASRAVRQNVEVVSAELGTRPPLYRWLLRRLAFRIGIAIARRVTPFDLEAYLRYHFTKVREQTRQLMHGYLDASTRTGVPADAVRALCERVFGA